MGEQSFSFISARKWNHTKIRTQVLNNLVNRGFEKSVHCIWAHPEHSLGGPLHKVHTAKEQWEITLKHCSWAAKQPPLNKWNNAFTESACIFLGRKCPTSPQPHTNCSYVKLEGRIIILACLIVVFFAWLPSAALAMLNCSLKQLAVNAVLAHLKQHWFIPRRATFRLWQQQAKATGNTQGKQASWEASGGRRENGIFNEA